MGWFEFALLDAFCAGGLVLVSRSILKEDDDHRVFALLMQFIPLLLWVPLLFVEPVRFPSQLEGGVLLVLAGLFWAAQQLVLFKSLKHTEVSFREPIYKTQLVWSALLAVFFLGETLTEGQVFGMGLILSGSVVLGYTGFRKKSNWNGTFLVLLAALLLGVVLILDKLAVAHFNANAYPFFVTLFSGTFMAIACWRSDLLERSKAQLDKHGRKIALAALFAALGYWAFIQALSQGSASLVVSVHQTSLVFATLGGIVLLHEKKDVPVKVAGMALALAGALLLRPV